MKLFHLSDLHLGKRVNEFSMAEDQRYILGQILTLADRERPDGVLLAGDIYDKPVPSGEAVLLLDWFLTELAERKYPVCIVSGNHDSAERLAFGARLMNARGIFLSQAYEGQVEKIGFEDAHGPVTIHLLPFISLLQCAMLSQRRQRASPTIRRLLRLWCAIWRFLGRREMFCWLISLLPGPCAANQRK